MESEEEFVFKLRQNYICVESETEDSLIDNENDNENEKTIMSKSFKEGDLETIDQLNFFSLILIKKTKIF